MSGREKLKRLEKIVNFLIFIIKIIPLFIRVYLFNLFRNVGGSIGLMIRYLLFKTIAKKCGNNVSIHPGSFLFNIHNISVGDNVSIHPLCYLDAYGGISIGNDVSIAHNCSILSTNHMWGEKNISIKYNKVTKGECIVEDDVWIGCGTRVLSGVRIAKRSVIAAGAVVNKNVPPNSVVGGVPFKVLKQI